MRSRAVMPCTALVAVLTAASCVGDPPAPVPPVSTAGAGASAGASRTTPGGASQALPPGHPITTTRATDAVPSVPQGAGTGATALVWAVPSGWKAETPSSSMRRAQYRVPGRAGDAECVVFYFGPGQGGDAASNAKRWASQFRQPDGKDSAAAPKTSALDVSGLGVTLVEVKGTYAGGMGAMAGEKPGYALLGAIAAGPDANWFFKLTGPEATVSAQRTAFEGLVRSLKKGS